KNFRQHADTEIDFRPGLTGIIGPNGSGKSTILEAIAWAIYGSQAARGTNETIRFARAQPRSRVEVDLRFALGEQEYRVVRSMHTAEVYLDNGPQPVAATLAGVSIYLQQRLGMTREEFFNTYFTGQKELQFLATMGPTERGRFLSQVLGYERLRRAQDLARDRKRELRAEIRVLQGTLGDLGELVEARIDAQRRTSAALSAYSAAQTETAQAAAELRAFLPKWEAAQTARDRHRELTHAIETAGRDRENAVRDVERATGELGQVEKAEAELAPLREALQVLPQLNAECERWEDLARKEERRKALARQLQELDAELVRGRERMQRLETAPGLEKKYAGELELLRAERETVSAELEEKKNGWLRDRQDADTKLQTYRDRARELQEQIRQIRELGPEGKCPTCGRPVGKDYERLLDRLEDEFQEVKQDGIWWKSRFEQLQDKPDEVAELEKRDRALDEAIDDRSTRYTRCQAAVQELETLTGERSQRERRRQELAEELESVPGGYDVALHRQVEAAVRHLRAQEKQAAGLEQAVARREEWEKELEQAKGRQAEAVRAEKAATAELKKLGFSEEDFAAVKAEHDAATARHRAAELAETEQKGAVRTAEQALQAAQRAEAQYHERAKELEKQKGELDHLDELDDAYTELRRELNDHVRPELSEIASMFLAQLTDGRYTSMEISETYDLMVLDEGEEKPVISGGEEDVANLVLRLSLSQMIADRAGHPLSLLILDEVFGSLDVARRDNVVALLHNLEDRFEQVILITHIEGIRESLDQVLRVEYDERTGTSVVREEDVRATPPDLLAA
ncbi:MAG TPA: SMC family ATPase, partial [Longimicrobiaceae bacterium]|nr:SMC family ATPase [Longimicrobiaceae bacterium]